MSATSDPQGLILFKKGRRDVIKWGPNQLGVTCERFLSSTANFVGDAFGKAAHKLGFGPVSALEAILKKLGEKGEETDRKTILEDWYRCADRLKMFPGLDKDCARLLNHASIKMFPGLGEDCARLLDYASMKKERKTQMIALEAIVVLITRYPPIRETFLCHESFKGTLDPQQEALKLWNKDDKPEKADWVGLYQLAAASLCGDIPKNLKKIPVADWGKVDPTNSNVLDELLIKLSSEKLEAVDRISIRYLGGILEFPTFWEDDYYEIHGRTAIHIVQKLSYAAKEIGIDSGISEDHGDEIYADTRGLDSTIKFVLVGIQVWLMRIDEREVASQVWFNDFQALLDLLLRPEARNLLPAAWKKATDDLVRYSKEQWERQLDNSNKEGLNLKSGIGKEHEIALHSNVSVISIPGALANETQETASLSSNKKEDTETAPPPSSGNEDNTIPYFIPPSRIHALVIGIDKYKSPRHVLDGGVADAKEMEMYLRMTFPDSVIETIYDEQATRKGIINAIRGLMENPDIKFKDPILIFYAGHGSETTPPGDWDTHDQKIQMLMPVDYDDDETFITDIGFARLLEQLASRKGDNVVVILDCCHSGSMTREFQQDLGIRGRSRSIQVTKPLSDKVDEDILGLKGIRAAGVPKGFQYNGTTSHVLLAACGANEYANENDGRGAFTRALLDTITRTGYEKLTYSGLIRNIPKLHRKQAPRCEGVNRDRFLFQSRLPPQGKLFLDVYAEENQVKVRAGAVHGVTIGSEFTVYEGPDEESTIIGTYGIRNITATICTLKDVNTTSITLPAYALQSRIGEDDALLVSFTDNPGMYNIKQTLIRDLYANQTLLERCSFVSRDKAQLEVDIKDGYILFNIVNNPISSLGMRRMPYRVKQHERMIACDVIRASAQFERYLRYNSKKSSISHQIKVELLKVERVSRLKWGPASGNLCRDNYVQVVAGKTLYGIKITNNSPFQLYPHLFHFDHSDLSIDYYYRPPIAQGQYKDAPLQPYGGVLTIGYGTRGATPWSYDVRDEERLTKATFFQGRSPEWKVLQEKQDLDVGVFKLFLTTQPTDLSYITQNSPFTESRSAMKYTSEISGDWDTVSIVVAIGRTQQDLPFPP